MLIVRLSLKFQSPKFVSLNLYQSNHVMLTLLQTKSIWFHTYTVWLFTSSDIKSVIVPETLLGLSSALSGSLLTTNTAPNLMKVLARTPQVVIWNWLNLLLFDVDNQFQPNSVLEDSVNKPWRAIPSQRLTAAQARRLLLVIIPTVFLSNALSGRYSWVGRSDGHDVDVQWPRWR